MVENAKEERAKDEILADLYALRGGLSVISERVDVLKESEEKIRGDIKLEEKKYRQEYHECLNELEKNRETKEKLTKDVERQEEWCKQASSDRFFDAIKDWGVFLVTLFIGLFGIVGFVALNVYESGNESSLFYKMGKSIFSVVGESNSNWVGYAFIIIGILSSIAFVCFGIFSCFDSPGIRTFFTFTRHLPQIREKWYNKDIEKLRVFNEKWTLLEEEVQRSKNNYDGIINDMKSIVVSRMKEKNTVELEKLQEIKVSLNEIYDVWLSESDWENVDLLIYYMETGRADALKEALQLVDRQRQTDQIVRAIKTASQSICGSIQLSVDRLGDALSKSFSVISSQIASLGGHIDLMTNAIKEGNDIQQRQTELQRKQLSATELNNALLEKSNMTSRALLNDLRYGQQFWVK